MLRGLSAVGRAVSYAWRRSLQLRVVSLTLGLSLAVIMVLGFVLTSQITDRVLEVKVRAATEEIERARNTVSGIVGGLFAAPRNDRGWRLAFLAGLGLGGAALLAFDPAALPAELPAPWPVIVLGGLLVGFGSRGANGCTSGHGVCGLGRRSPRSLVAVLVFMATGILAAQVLRPLLVGGAS